MKKRSLRAPFFFCAAYPFLQQLPAHEPFPATTARPRPGPSVTVSRVFLVGPMGAGKTTIGKRLAKALKKRFFDADQELEQRTGASVTLIFDVEGEAGFREREKRIIDELTALDDIVLATGGGAVLDADNRARLSSRGFVVYLHAAVEHLVDRTRRDANRPLLQTDDPAARLAELMAEREPLYREVADLVVDTGELALHEVLKTIRGAIR